ncbi:MAG: hypothetical protein Q8L63_04585 [Alphaproteobacteria bacterium]|nr:hypothetical protein [Alphaproteobacteria bacterium]
MSNAAMPAQESGAVDPLGTTTLDARVNAILSLTHQLTGLITSETTLLKTRRAATLRETETEKARLSSLYAREMRAIKARPELLAGISARQKKMLHAASVAFKACVVTHVRTLSRIRAVSESLVVAIGEELNRKHRPMTSYKGPNGPIMTRSSAASHSPAFGFDRSI